MRRPTLLLSLTALFALVLAACGSGNGDPEPFSAPTPPDEAAGFDEVASIETAERYLGVAEADIEETVMVRILRRGDEQFAGTMDLRPGRLNLELDEDDDGVYRVTRVRVEAEDGDRIVE